MSYEGEGGIGSDVFVGIAEKGCELVLSPGEVEQAEGVGGHAAYEGIDFG